MSNELNEITREVIGAAIAVHRELGPGQLEARLRAFAPLGYRPGLLALVGVDRLPYIPLARFSGLTSLWGAAACRRFHWPRSGIKSQNARPPSAEPHSKEVKVPWGRVKAVPGHRTPKEPKPEGMKISAVNRGLSG